MDRLEFESAYPTDPKTSADYIRKWRMERGVSQVDLAGTLGLNEMNRVNWEIRGWSLESGA